MVQVGLDLVNEDLGNDFVGKVTQSNGSEVPNSVGIGAFGDEIEVSSISLFWHGFFPKDFMVKIHGFVANSGSVLRIKVHLGLELF